MGKTKIKELDKEEVYKYLVLNQLLRIKDTELQKTETESLID